MITENTSQSNEQPTTQAISPPANPLSQFMRHTEIYISLPSQGYYNDENDIELTPNGELGVAPMTTGDDLELKSPEGLLNGEAIGRVISSCCPGVKNVYNLTVPDLDVILLAIRQASYGDIMDFEVTCPECSHEGIYKLSISETLLHVGLLEPEYSLKLSSDVTVFLKPFTYANSVKESMQKYKEAQTMRLLIDEDLSQDVKKAAQFSSSLKTLTDLMTQLYSDSIVKILDPSGEEMQVTREQIHEWMKFLPRKDAELIQDELAKINSMGVPKKKLMTCSECDHSWENDINFDPSNFFDLSS